MKKSSAFVNGDGAFCNHILIWCRQYRRRRRKITLESVVCGIKRGTIVFMPYTGIVIKETVQKTEVFGQP